MDDLAESIEQRVVEIVAEQMGVPREKIKRESRFKEDLGADSLETVELVMELEEEFDINIPDDVAVTTRTAGQAVEYAQKRLGGKITDGEGLPLDEQVTLRQIDAVVEQMKKAGFAPGDGSTWGPVP